MENNVINEKSDGIKVKGHIGTWYVIGNHTRQGTQYFLLEHETYGGEVASVIVTAGGALVVEDVWNGFDDLEEHFEYLSMKEEEGNE